MQQKLISEKYTWPASTKKANNTRMLYINTHKMTNLVNDSYSRNTLAAHSK